MVWCMMAGHCMIGDIRGTDGSGLASPIFSASPIVDGIKNGTRLPKKEVVYTLNDLGITLILKPLVFGQWAQTAAQLPLMQLSTVSEAPSALTARPVIAYQVDLGRPPTADYVALGSAALGRGAADTPSVA
ncbi:hypothetical protein DFH08DRAFT_824984 [Mycena albidolilacea]|uniref:Uncharacterized protein n=1 Tax=Mycena albidolilacea TaxID=1033008 RepID=A0AAD6Z4B6_9AGAR|nr:hypothetical protein DFH08DRAFT_824984 [Mycena albidolilacea]